jgi:hypothetical protein
VSARRNGITAKQIAILLAAAPMLAACGGLSDFSLKDQEWFARPGRIFKAGNTSIETPPLTPTREVTANDLIGADGACAGMSAPVAPDDANANASPEAAPQPVTAPVALGHTECDVVRAIAVAPDDINLSTNERGDRVALLTWRHGPRPGAYTFTAGRLSAIERVDVPPPERPARGAKKKRG